MRDVYVIGSHTTRFGKHLDIGIKELAAMTAEGVLQDAGLAKKDVQSVWFSNSGWGMRDWQHCIRGQVALRPYGLISRGHPIGASGLAQINELVTQLRGEAGKRQVDKAGIALAENGGGALGNEEAAMCIHILEKP